VTVFCWLHQSTGYATDFTALGVEVEPFQREKFSPSNAIRYAVEHCFERSQASPYRPSDNSESFGGMILTGEDKNLSHCHFVLTNLTWADLGSKPASSVRGRHPNRLLHSTAITHSKLQPKRQVCLVIYIYMYSYLYAYVKEFGRCFYSLVGVSTLW
jgi:hypothetical protein